MKKLLYGGTVFTADDKNYDAGFIEITGEKITSVGDMSQCPAKEGYEAIDVSGLFLYPGFIDAHCHIGMWEDGLGFEGADGNEETDPVTPQLRGLDGVNPLDNCFAEAALAGVTAVVTGPGSANPIGGTLFCMHTHGDISTNRCIKEPIAMKMALGENPKSGYREQKRAPMTRMATMSLIREALNEAKAYERQDSPSYNAKSEALLQVEAGNLPVHIHAHRLDDIYAAVRLSKEYDLKTTVVHATEAYLDADALADCDISLILGPLMCERSKPELRNLTPKAPAIIANSKIKFAICTDHPVIPIQYLPLMAGLAVREGLSRERALRSITADAAEIIGLEHKIGRIKTGLYADIAVFDGDAMSLEGRCVDTFIKGERVNRAQK